MATLFNTRISDTYPGLIKTTDNAAISATLKQLSDGSGNLTGLYLNNAGDFKVTSILEFGSLKDTAENITITKFVDSADGIPNNNNDTSIPTSKAVKDFVETHVTAQDLDFRGDDSTVLGDVDLDSEAFIILGTANEIETTVSSAGGNTLQIGIPVNPALSGQVQIAGTIDFADNAKARFGTSQDLEIYHNSTLNNNIIQSLLNRQLSLRQDNFVVKNQAGDKLMISAVADGAANLYFNDTKRIETVTAGAKVTGDLEVTGSITGSGGSFLPLAGGTMTGNTIHNDNVKSIYGTATDGLWIYHDGSNSYLNDQGTGELKLTASSVAIQSASGNEYIAYFAGTGGQTASLYAGNSKKLETSSTGVTITGRLSGLTDPTLAQDAATKAYVDNLDAASDLDFSDGSTASSVDLNTETFAIIGTANEVETTTSVGSQQLQIGLPSSISVNSASATALQTARDISLTGQATATISGFDGSSNVSGAVTLDNNSVTGKVLTGLASPTASNILASDSILQAFGKAQSQINTLAGGLRFMGTWNATSNTPTLASGGGEADSGTTTGTATNKLIQSGQNFTSTVTNGDQVVNQASGATALVTNVDSNTQLTLDADIMVSGQAYTIDNSPFITQGHYYVVSVGGTQSLNGLSNWAVGDWVIAGAGNTWEKLDHTQVDGTGTAGNIAKFSSTNVIADSIMAESGSTISVTGQLTTTQKVTSGGDLQVDGNKINMGAIMLEDSAAGRLGFNRNTATGVIHDSNYNAFQFNGADVSGVNGMLEIQEYAGSGGYAGSTYISGNNIKLNAYIIHNNDTNTFYGFSANDNFILKTNNTTQLFVDGTNTYLYYDGTQKLRTSSQGVVVSGTAGATGDVLITSDTLALLQLEDSGLSKTYNIEIGRSSTAGDLTFRSSDGEKVRFTESGIVGIGIDNPGNVNGVTFTAVGLHVKASTLGRTITEGSSFAEFIANHSSASSNQKLKFLLSQSGSLVLGAMDDDGTRRTQLTLSNSNAAEFKGDVTISNATPALNLLDTDNSSNISFSSVGGALIVNSTADQVYQIGGSEHVRITTAGDVNIGVASATSSSKVTIQSQGANGSDMDALVIRNYSASPFTGKVSQKFQVGTVDMAAISGERIDSNNGNLLLRTNKAGTMTTALTLAGNNLNKATFNGIVQGYSFGVEEVPNSSGTITRIFAPAGACYDDASGSSVTGSLMLILPQAGVNCMMRGKIRVFTYVNNESFDVNFAGYYYSGNNWTRIAAWIDSQSNADANYTVRFGTRDSDGKGYIRIGELSASWSYPKFELVDFMASHSNSSFDAWGDDWDALIVTSLTGYSDGLAVADAQVNNLQRSGNDLYYTKGQLLLGKTSGSYRLDMETVSGGNAFRTTRGTSSFRIFQANNGASFMGTENNADLNIQSNSVSRLTICDSGNITVGNFDESGTPYSDYHAIEIGRQGNTISAAPWKSNIYFSVNASITAGSTQFTYRHASEAANRFDLEDGEFIFANAPSGTAGANITWNERMKIQLDGNVAIGSQDYAAGGTLDVQMPRNGTTTYTYIGDRGNANGQTNPVLLPINKTSLVGYSVPYPAGLGGAGSRLTTCGFLQFESQAGWTGGQRTWAITSGFDTGGSQGGLSGNKLAIIAGNAQNVEPQLGNNGDVGSGTVDGANTLVAAYWDNGMHTNLEKDLKMTGGGAIYGKNYTVSAQAAGVTEVNCYTGIIPETGIYDIFVKGNPNIQGSGAYASTFAGYISIACDYISSIVKFRISQATIIQDGGGSSNRQLVVTASLYNSADNTNLTTQPITAQSTTQILINVSQYLNTAGSNQDIRIVRRL